MARINKLVLSIILLSLFIVPFTARTYSPLPTLQGSNLKFQDPNPVVNEGGQLMLTATDGNGNPVSNVTFESGSPDIASVNPQTGMVIGVKSGVATITARRGTESFSTFVIVANVKRSKGAKVMGDIKVDTGGSIYITDPLGSLILKKDGFADPPVDFAGQKGNNGRRDGPRITMALFGGPTEMAIDNSNLGGIFVADTLNHSIRQIGFDDEVHTRLGTGSPGTNGNSITPFSQAAFSSPKGVAVMDGGLLIADTDNHAIFFADFDKEEVRLLAGKAGEPGNADGPVDAARFTRPAGIAVNTDRRSIAVADTGNNSVRLITPDGMVTTIRRASSPGLSALQSNDFNSPQSVGFDRNGNLYVVDNSGVQVIIDPEDNPRILPLAQPGTFGKARSVVVDGTSVLVLDEDPPRENEELVEVTIGPPQITSLSQNMARLEGGAEITIIGKNFTPESLVVLGDTEIPEEDTQVVSATEIRFRVPGMNEPGIRTLSVRTRGGIAQRDFTVVSKPLSELANGEITTVAGGVPFIGDGGSPFVATLGGPSGLTIDAFGNLLFADVRNHRVRKTDFSIGDAGVIVTVAGSGTFGKGNPDGIDALAANLTEPGDVAIDSAGNFYTNDFTTIVQIDSRTGKLKNVFTPPDSSVRAFTFDSQDNLYIVSVDCNCVRRVNIATGEAIVFAGIPGEAGYNGDNLPANRAKLSTPNDIAIDANDNIFIADSFNNRIRRIDATSGIITTVAGGSEGGFAGDGGPATSAQLLSPLGIAVDAAGNLFIADTENQRIRRVDGETGIINTVAGTSGQGGFEGDGGPAIAAKLSAPTRIAVDGADNLYISDTGNNRIRFVFNEGDDATNLIFTIVGTGAIDSGGDGIPAVQGRLFQPGAVVFDTTGNLYIASSQSGVASIRRVDKETQLIQTIAGNGSSVGDGGPAKDSFLSTPIALDFDRSGNLLILDSGLSTLRRIVAAGGRIDPSSTIERIAGNGEFNFSGDNGPAQNASFNQPNGLAVDSSGNIFIADSGNNRVRRIDAATNIITTIAGTGTAGFSGDNGQARNAQISFPTALAFDQQGNLYIGDSDNRRVRRVDARTGIITTFAGSDRMFDGGEDGDNGPALQAAFSTLIGDLIFDSGGNLFISDTFLNRVRKVDTRGTITRVAGNGGNGGLSGDGGSAINAGLRAPLGLTIDKDGNLFIADLVNDSVRVVKGVAMGQGGGQPALTITDARFIKPNLTISGSGFGASGARVSVNGADVSATIVNQSDTSLTLKGNKKKLNLKKGANQVAVTAGGVTSNTFVFNF
jgi:sugar lactone lactonase YvrE